MQAEEARGSLEQANRPPRADPAPRHWAATGPPRVVKVNP